MRDLNFESARLFLIAYEEGSLTRAADRGRIALSAVTKRIQDLETHFGITLFDRHARGVTPTPAADELARHVRTLRDCLDGTTNAMHAFSHGVRGCVSVIASPSAIVGGLAACIVAFGRKNPDILVDLRETHGWSLIPNIESGRADLGLSLSPLDLPSSLTRIPYRKAALVVAVPSGHTLAARDWVAFDDLVEFEHVTLGPKSTLCMFLVRLATERGRILKYRSVSSFDVMRAMIAAGLGIGVLSEIVAEQDTEGLGLQCLPLREPWAERWIQIYHRRELLSPTARLFLDHLLTSEGLTSQSEKAELVNQK